MRSNLSIPLLNLEALSQRFTHQFGYTPTHGLYSPGRVNLIGDHIDYCGGLVMPMALSVGSAGVFRANGTSTVNIYSTRFDERAAIAPHAISLARGHWSDYAAGVFQFSAEKIGNGFDLLIDSDIGSGGLSSSASFTTAIATAANHVATGRAIEDDDLAIRLEMARLCQRAETDYVGLNCGIMDQASIVLGGIIELNCSNLTFKRLEPQLDDYCFVIGDTKKDRALAASAYNQRVEETTQGLTELRTEFDMRNLAALEVTDLDHALTLLSSETLVKRVRHVVTENSRVKAAGEKLNLKDLDGFGELMNQSHQSLKDDFEVTGLELDLLSSLSRQCEGVLGSRVTGAGFGGCIVSLVKKDAVESYRDSVREEYQAQTGLLPIFTVSEAGPGTRSWSL